MADLFQAAQGGPVADGNVTPEQKAKLLQYFKSQGQVPPQAGAIQAPNDPMQPPLQPEPDPGDQLLSPDGPTSEPKVAPLQGRTLAEVVGPGKFNSQKASEILQVPGDTQIDPRITQQLVSLLKDQKKGIQDSRDNLDIYKKMSAQGDNLSPLLGLVDAYTGSHLEKSYEAPDDPEKRLETIGKLQNYIQNQQGALTKDVSGLTMGDAKNNKDLMRTIAMMAGKDPNAAIMARESKEDRTAAAKLNHDLDYNLASSRQNFGRYGVSYGAVNKISAILKKHPDFNLTENETADLGTALASLMQNGGGQGITDARIEGVTPASAAGWIQKKLSRIENKPLGLKQQQFIQRFAEDVDAERVNTVNQLRTMQKGIAAGHPLRFRNPTLFNQVLASKHLDPDNLETEDEMDASRFPTAPGGQLPQGAPPQPPPGTTVTGRKLPPPLFK